MACRIVADDDDGKTRLNAGSRLPSEAAAALTDSTTEAATCFPSITSTIVQPIRSEA